MCMTGRKYFTGPANRNGVSIDGLFFNIEIDSEETDLARDNSR